MLAGAKAICRLADILETALATSDPYLGGAIQHDADALTVKHSDGAASTSWCGSSVSSNFGLQLISLASRR